MKERIEQILEDKRLTQAEFATRAGIAPATITHLFNGRNNLSETVVSKILLAYPEINPIWLLNGTGEKYKQVKEELPLFNEEPAMEERQVQTQPIAVQPVASASPIVQEIPQTADAQKQIRKIVFFYADKTFEEYYPQ